MGDPHREDRYGEVWPAYRITTVMPGLEALRPFVTISGGWAWHFLSPVGHDEFKHAHDHKDVDLFVPKANVGAVMGILAAQGFAKATTKYDRLPSPEEFRRYERTAEVAEHPGGSLRLTIDFFVGDHPTLVTPEGWQVVRPDVLLSFYGKVHDSDKCWAVQAASRLLENGETVENLVGRGDLLACPTLPVYVCTHCGWAGQFPKTGPEVGVRSGGHWCQRCPYGVSSVGSPTYRPLSDMKAIFDKTMADTGRFPSRGR